jgi:hypothetical protein
MNKDEAKRILLVNLKGSKTKHSSLLVIAKAVRLLINDKEYGSTSKLAESFHVKRPTIESFDRMNDQPEEIKNLIQEGQIRIDASTKLSSIPDLKRRVNFAKAVAELSAKDTRQIIDYCKKHPNLSPEECKKAIADSKPIKKQVQSIAISLESKEYEAFLAASKKAGLKLEEAGKLAISQWVSKQD